jgi:hypothetical protein
MDMRGKNWEADRAQSLSGRQGSVPVRETGLRMDMRGAETGQEGTGGFEARQESGRKGHKVGQGYIRQPSEFNIWLPSIIKRTGCARM